jgi:hypothetical protein
MRPDGPSAKAPLRLSRMKAFRLEHSVCCKCHSPSIRLDWTCLSNLWRVPWVSLTALIFFPVGRVGMQCPGCGRRQLVSVI